MQVKVTSDMEFLRVRSGAGTANPMVAAVKNGVVVEVLETKAASNGAPWYRIVVPMASTPQLYSDETLAKQYALDGWIMAALTQAVGTPTPTPARKTMVGIGNIFDLASAYEQLGKYGFASTAVIQNPNGAYEMKQRFPNAYISARADLYGGYMPSHEWYHKQMGDLRGLKGMIAEGLNEYDHAEFGSPAGIKARAEWDAVEFEWCKSMGYTYVGASWPVGNPEIRQDVFKAIHDYYGPLWKKGMWIGYHPYSGDDHSGLKCVDRMTKANEIMEADFPRWDGSTYHYKGPSTIWLEDRWRLLFECGGLDPSADSWIWCSEGGLDQNPGGFAGWGCTPEYVGNYAAWIQDVLSAPLVVGGVSYPSKVLAVELFQRGNPQRWGSYTIDDAMIAAIARKLNGYTG